MCHLLDEGVFVTDQLGCDEQSLFQMRVTSEGFEQGDKFESDAVAGEVQRSVARVAAILLAQAFKVFDDLRFPGFHQGVDKGESRGDCPRAANSGNTGGSRTSEQMV